MSDLNALSLSTSTGIIKDDLIYITENQRRVIATSPSIPLAMRRDTWELENLSLEEEVYRGMASIVYKVR